MTPNKILGSLGESGSKRKMSVNLGGLGSKRMHDATLDCQSVNCHVGIPAKQEVHTQEML